MGKSIIDELIEDYGFDARALLDSLVSALGNAALEEHLEHIARVEDWPCKVKRVDGELEVVSVADEIDE